MYNIQVGLVMDEQIRWQLRNPDGDAVALVKHLTSFLDSDLANSLPNTIRSEKAQTGKQKQKQK